MGIRETQIFGLKEEAEKFLNENVQMIPDIVCPDCGKVITEKKNFQVYDVSGSPVLRKFVLNDGKAVLEVLNKYQPYSSGPCLFIDLIDENGKILFGWTNEEIDERI